MHPLAKYYLKPLKRVCQSESWKPHIVGFFFNICLYFAASRAILEFVTYILPVLKINFKMLGKYKAILKWKPTTSNCNNSL